MTEKTECEVLFGRIHGTIQQLQILFTVALHRIYRTHRCARSAFRPREVGRRMIVPYASC
jgi:hypothetical protein